MDVNDVIASRLKYLAECLDELRSYSGQVSSYGQYMGNRMLRRAVERTLQIAIETCLDIGSHLISTGGFRYPEESRDIFLALNQEGVLSDGLIEPLLQMVALRNILVHEYVHVSDRIVYDVLKRRLADFDAFAREMVTWMEGEE